MECYAKVNNLTRGIRCDIPFIPTSAFKNKKSLCRATAQHLKKRHTEATHTKVPDKEISGSEFTKGESKTMSTLLLIFISCQL
eukprot:snap_masked-scaffold_50-processed-gene-1.40-mRNA-1 protein AED:1.00 eAED:1.00 QI:0/-1/0/0/-1/1/1/0/82